MNRADCKTCRAWAARITDTRRRLRDAHLHFALARHRTGPAAKAALDHARTEHGELLRHRAAHNLEHRAAP